MANYIKYLSYLFVCLSVSLSPGYLKKYWTDFHVSLWKVLKLKASPSSRNEHEGTQRLHTSVNGLLQSVYP